MQLIVTTEKEITKSGITAQANTIIEKVKSGDKSALDAFMISKVLEETAKQIRSGVQEDALKELYQYGGNTNLKGVELTQKEAGVKYDYSNTPLWVELNQKVESAKAELKQLEAELRPLKASKDILIDGVVETVYPPIKTSTTTIETKFGK